MGWVEFHASTIKKLQKFHDFRLEMRWSVNEALGFLGNLWGEVLEIHEDGDISGLRPEYIVMLTDAKANPLVLRNALVKHGWLDENSGRLLVHDWLDYVGRWLRRKYGGSENAAGWAELDRIWKLHGQKYGDKLPRKRQRKTATPKRPESDTKPAPSFLSFPFPSLTTDSAAKPRSKPKEKKTKHPQQSLQQIVQTYLDASGKGGSEIAADQGGWGRWMLEADALMSALEPHVTPENLLPVVCECIQDRAKEWAGVSDWTISGVTRRATDWLAKKQSEVKR